jgi:hypothetical protein
MATASKSKSTTKHSSKKSHLAAKKPRKKKSQGSFLQRLFTSSSSEPEPKPTPGNSASGATGVTDLEPVAKALEIAKNLAHKGTELLSPSSDEKPAGAKPKAKSAARKAAEPARGKSSKTSHSAPRKAARPANRTSRKTAARGKAR